MFIIGRPFQPSLMLVDKAISLHNSKSTLKVLQLCRLWLYSQTLYKAGKDTRVKHSSFLQTLINYDRKQFYNIVPRLTTVKSFRAFKVCLSFQMQSSVASTRWSVERKVFKVTTLFYVSLMPRQNKLASFSQACHIIVFKGRNQLLEKDV